MSKHVHDCPADGCNGYTVCTDSDCEIPQQALCWVCTADRVKGMAALAERVAEVRDWAQSRVRYCKEYIEDVTSQPFFNLTSGHDERVAELRALTAVLAMLDGKEAP